MNVCCVGSNGDDFFVEKTFLQKKLLELQNALLVSNKLFRVACHCPLTVICSKSTCEVKKLCVTDVTDLVHADDMKLFTEI